MKRLLTFCFTLLLCLSVYAQNKDEQLGLMYLRNGEYEKAVVIFEKLFSTTQNFNYYDPYFTSLLKLKRYPEAEALINRLLKDKSDFRSILSIDLGRVYQESGQPERTKALYESLIRNLPKDEFAIRDLANAFYRAEAYDHSINTLKEGRKLLGDDKAFVFDLIGLYRYRKDKAMLVEEYLNVLESAPPEAANSYMRQAQSAIAFIFEENTDYDMLQTALLRRLQKNPQNIAYSELLSWQYIQKKEYNMALRQTLALDRRLKEDGTRVYDLSRLFIANKAYEPAVEALNYLVLKDVQGPYYVQSKMGLLLVKNKIATSGKYTKEQLQQLEKDYQSFLQEFGKGIITAEATRQLANLQAFYLNNPSGAEKLLEDLIEIPGLPYTTQGQVKLELGDIYILTGELWEASLLYGQVTKQFSGQPIGQEATYRNAKLAYYQGDFNWAKSQLDVLKAATSQLISNDALNLGLLLSDNLQNEQDTATLKKYAYADMLISINRTERALAVLDSIKAFNLADDILMSKARIYQQQGDFAQVQTIYEDIIANHSFSLWMDDAIFGLADLYESKLNQPVKAKDLYQKIITDYPGSLYVIEARKRFRNLRGDQMGS